MIGTNRTSLLSISYYFHPKLPNRIGSSAEIGQSDHAIPPPFLLSSISRDFGRAIRSIYGERLDGNEAASRRIGVTDFRYGSNTCNSWRLSSRMVCASKNVESIFSPPTRDSLLTLIIPRPRYS